ncbi:hypothetical protein BLNAU_24257 [Blattamonas nauphoetae]|uniref:Uncharacterized protein n=1 Tax=Blattamonas nauphoetae TaxID=2049346 RepID=A0ABQ9WMW7_9EUKA|nr:hypothetical protein BLNAU_24257 [Blattamonas nauphoetae]
MRSQLGSARPVGKQIKDASSNIKPRRRWLRFKRPIRSRKSNDLSSHILPGGLTPTVALLRQMESPDIDYKIQKLHVNMSMCVLSKEEYAAELRDHKREKWEREQKVREHQKRGYSPQQTLGPLRVERIHRQARQPHGEDHAIRSRTASMEERKTVANAVRSVTENVPTRKRMKAMEEARIREAERRKEGATWGYDLCGRKGGIELLKRRNGKMTWLPREGELKRKKQEVGNEEEMEGMKKERGGRERGMGKESEGAEVREVGRE